MQMPALRKPLLGLAVFAALLCGLFFLALEIAPMGKLRAVLKGRRFYSLAFSPDSKLVAAGEHDGNLTIWETANGAEWFTLPADRMADFDFSAAIVAFAFSPDGTTLAWGEGDRTVTIFDLQTKQVTKRFPPYETRIVGLSFTSKPTVLATVTRGGLIRLLDLDTDESWVAFDAMKSRYYNPIVGSVVIGRACMDARGKTLALGLGGDLVFLDVSQRRQEREIAHAESWGGLGALDLSADGNKLAVGGPDVVSFFDSGTGGQLGTIPVKQGAAEGCVRYLAFSPDGRMLALGLTRGEHLASDLSVWDLDEKLEISRFACHAGPLSQIAWSPDGKTIATASDELGRSSVKLWNVASILKSRRK